jgi:cell wall-associated NlpC family hydrolase
MKRSLIAALAALPIALTVGIAVAAPASGALDPAACTGTITPDPDNPTGGSPLTIDNLSSTQMGYARIIFTVAVQRKLPARAGIVALATALQESKLHNVDKAVDHDSLGLFQQRPSMGWGTPAEILDPVYSSTAFYKALARVKDWPTLPVTVAAQRVQRSAYPNAYAKWETLATQLVNQFATEQPIDLPEDPNAGCSEGDGLPPAGDVDLPDGLTLPSGTPATVATAIAWALAQRGTPYRFGGSCTEPHGSNPAKRCDCSSLMQQAYRHAGIKIGRTTLDQVHEGVAVPNVSAIAPGDLVLIAGSLGSRNRPRHVGMYIGEGLVVQAPKTGDVVKVSTLAAWRNQIAAIRRIVH